MRTATERTYRHIEARPVSGSLGAEILGVNAAAPPGDEVITEIRQAFLDHLVLFFRDQKLTPHEQLAFASRFGEPMEYPQLKGLPECPMITPVLKLAHEQFTAPGDDPEAFALMRRQLELGLATDEGIDLPVDRELVHVAGAFLFTWANVESNAF